MKLFLAISCSIFVLALLLALVFGFHSKQPEGKELQKPGPTAAHIGDPLAQVASRDSGIPRPGTQMAPSVKTVVTTSVGDPQRSNPVQVYVIRVMAAGSRAPVENASVQVEIADSPPEKRQGHTDADGFFTFKWRLSKQVVRTHISVHAKGFMPLDDDSPLAQDRILELEKPTYAD